MVGTQRLFQEIVNIHVDIENWFRGEFPRDQLGTLMERFAPDFSMTTTQGITLRRDDVGQMFTAMRGRRQDLRILVDNLHLLTTWHDGALLTYQETQSEGSSSSTIRQSTVAFKLSSDGTLLWHHLHETFSHE